MFSSFIWALVLQIKSEKVILVTGYLTDTVRKRIIAFARKPFSNYIQGLRVNVDAIKIFRFELDPVPKVKEKEIA